MELMSYVDHTLNKNKNGGYTLVTALLFFLVGSAAVVASLSDNILRETKMVKEEASSKQSYITSESALEDVLHRIKKNGSVGTTESMTLGSSTASVTTQTLPDGSKDVVSKAVSGTTYRNTESTVSAGSGVDFKYAVQGGVGGVELQAGIAVTGDIYTAGTLKGGNATIVGNATAAEVASTSLDQTYIITPGSTSSTVYFGNSDSRQDLAQSFTAGSNLSLQSVDVYIGKIGNPANITVKITGDNGGTPNYYNPLTSGTISSSLLTGATAQWVNVTLTSNPTLVPGQKYWIVLDGTPNTSSYYSIVARQGYTKGDLSIGRGDWGNWASNQVLTSGALVDMQFRTYVGNALIGVIGQDQYNKMTVSGDVYGNQVSYVSATGNVYCQTGTNNNKTCNTTRPNPTVETLTIPTEMIDSWKSSAQLGGVITGNTTIGQPPGQTIGPKKIVGNLAISSGTTVSINGPVWVTGNFSLNGGAKLFPGNDAKNYVIVVDGTVSISGGAFVSLSSGKILVVSTNTSDTAVSLDGGANDTALAAPNGGV